MEAHRLLGKGLLEVVYKHAIEYEFNQKHIPFSREKKFTVEYKGIVLPHYFYADFVVFDKIILEVKAHKRFADEHFSYLMNYLSISKLKIGLIVNFGENSLVTKRVIY